ncbi:MAG: Hsp20/alpha crystallin family protein [Rhodoferax sp.]
MASLRLFEPVLNDPFESMFRRFLAPTRMDRTLDELDVRVDVVENNGSFKVRADLPGVKKEDINVRIDGNLVQIDAESKGEKEFKSNGDKVLRSERYYGSVSRAFTLTQDVDDSKAVAKYEDGVLTLDLPKKASSAAKKLTIS